MKLIPCLVLAAATAQVFGAAPDSLSGKVYREYRLFSGRTNASERTLVLKTDGRYVSLKNAFGVYETSRATASLPDAHWGGITDPSPDGTYQYQKTGESQGMLTLVPDGGVGIEETLFFTTPYSGSTSPNGLNGLGGQSFYLTDLPNPNATALSNMSVRGTAVPGKPLILGFVVPGSGEREVLIRVVGPTLATMGVSGAWATPNLQLYRGSTPVFGFSFQFPYWSETPPATLIPGLTSNPEQGLRKIFSFVGAIPLPSGSKDIAVVVRLAPGAYTAIAAPQAAEAGGEALIEMYPLP